MLTLLLALSLSHAGKKSDLKAGAVAYERQDYSTAITALQTALSEPVRLKDSQQTQAHLLLARSLLAALSQAATSGDALTLLSLQDAPVEAAMSLLVVRSGGESWGEAEEMELAMVQGMLMQGVIGVLSSGEPTALAAFEDWADMSVDIGGYLSLDLRGQLRDGLGRSTEAYADYCAAIEVFGERTDSWADFLIAYTVYRTAAHAATVNGDLTAALAHLDVGLALLEGERSRLTTLTAEQQQRHDRARADLDSFRLSILLQSPALHEVALAELAAAVEQDPDRSIAHFNLGALHVNRAAALLAEANEEDNLAIAASLTAEGDTAFLRARPHLERALALDPTNREAIRVLKQIALQTDDIEAYRQLQEAEAALGTP
ncbi:MAG: tetratricopeptide (TPR) repeat protein [Myxococcota bacterium]|jgi:tetratricopeptide (TPR) repeat protein